MQSLLCWLWKATSCCAASWQSSNLASFKCGFNLWPLGGGACAAVAAAAAAVLHLQRQFKSFFGFLPHSLTLSLSLCFWHWFTFMSVKWPTGARQMKSVFDVRVRNGPNRRGYLARARVFGSRSDHLDHLTGVCYGLYYCLWWLSAALDQNSIYLPVQFSWVRFNAFAYLSSTLLSFRFKFLFGQVRLQNA